MCFWALLNIVKTAEKCYFVVKSLGFWRVKSRLMQSLFCQGNSLFWHIFLGLFEAKRCRGRKECSFSGSIMCLSVRKLTCQETWFHMEKWRKKACLFARWNLWKLQFWRVSLPNLTFDVWKRHTCRLVFPCFERGKSVFGKNLYIILCRNANLVLLTFFL